MKKIAVLSDIHSNYIAFKEILNELEKENIDEYILCGDYVVNGFEDNEFTQFVNKETNGDEKETSRLWNEMFIEYFKMKKLKVL